MPLVSESGCKVGDQVTGVLYHWQNVRGKFVFRMGTPKRYIVRKLFREGGAVIARRADQHRGWYKDIGMAKIFVPEHPPDIYVGDEFFHNFAVKE